MTALQALLIASSRTALLKSVAPLFSQNAICTDCPSYGREVRRSHGSGALRKWRSTFFCGNAIFEVMGSEFREVITRKIPSCQQNDAKIQDRIIQN